MSNYITGLTEAISRSKTVRGAKSFNPDGNGFKDSFKKIVLGDTKKPNNLLGRERGEKTAGTETGEKTVRYAIDARAQDWMNQVIKAADALKENDDEGNITASDLKPDLKDDANQSTRGTTPLEFAEDPLPTDVSNISGLRSNSEKRKKPDVSEMLLAYNEKRDDANQSTRGTTPLEFAEDPLPTDVSNISGLRSNSEKRKNPDVSEMLPAYNENRFVKPSKTVEETPEQKDKADQGTNIVSNLISKKPKADKMDKTIDRQINAA